MNVKMHDLHESFDGRVSAVAWQQRVYLRAEEPKAEGDEGVGWVMPRQAFIHRGST